jgi:hypothetical protein
VPDGPDAGTQPDTLGATAFSYFRGGAGLSGDPRTGNELYFYQQGLWGDGSTMRAFGSGYQQTQGAVTKFAFPGDPVANQVWSERNPGTEANAPGDRRFALHTGPFTLANGQAQDVVFGIVFGQGTNNLNSITALRAADALAQTAFASGFFPPPVAGESGPEAAEALRAAPNPFADVTRVAVGAQGEAVRAVLYDVLGREVDVVHDGPLSGDLSVSGAGLRPGLYVLRIQTAGAARTVRLVRR